MMKALYSGVSGMRVHQTKMDVIGNNISNVNTYGFKSQSVTFRDVYYQTLKTPSAGTTDRGGTNASQVGYGAQLGSIETMHTTTGYSPSSKNSHLYINGEGYFMVQNSKGEELYTRLGAFTFDVQGNLVDPSGAMVMGWTGTGLAKYGPTDPNAGMIDVKTTVGNAPVPINIAPPTDVEYTNVTINQDGSITAIYNYKGTGTAPAEDGKIVNIGLISVANFKNPDGLVLEGSSYYTKSANSGEPSIEAPGMVSTGNLITNALEMSNVDLANEFSDMIITQRGFQANTKIISVVDQMLEELVNLKR